MSVALSIDPCEVQIKAIRAQGPGGQNVHKVATAVQLFFDIRASSLPQEVKERCLALADQRITQDGVVVIKAQSACAGAAAPTCAPPDPAHLWLAATAAGG